ncbi:glycosyltransferase family 2 protein [Weissella cibaria]|uniref:glycosyltransferase family 2 protein n=1 Tax=Weissella cibaria TaxID=137591 RepID=UPI00136B5F72|nr:glycosyltransferase family 2 protein [Weissella cibaria]MBZ5941044.1 glycosyltransferase family 2 protein [Weissella cibaria]MYV35532.1 glycosyltransferase [Weissella cibaria]
MAKVSAVIVTYNRLPMLKEAIAALQAVEPKLSHLIVIDNKSEQDTQDYLESLGDSITYVRMSENLGGAGGFNAGIRYFYEQTEDDYVWVMDDDTMVHPDSLQPLTAFAEQNPNFGFLASKVMFSDGKPSVRNVLRQYGTYNTTLNTEFKEPVRIENATFVSSFFSRDIVRQIGLPITEFFIWIDDLEYTERAGRIAPGYLVPASSVTHKMRSNTEDDITNDIERRLPWYFNMYRNRVYTMRKRDFFRHMRGNGKIAWDFLRLIFVRTDHKKKRFDTMISGIKAGRKFKPTIEFPKDK